MFIYLEAVYLSSFALVVARLHPQIVVQVKVIVNLKGRQNEFRNIAIELIKRFQNDIGEVPRIFVWAYKFQLFLIDLYERFFFFGYPYQVIL